MLRWEVEFLDGTIDSMIPTFAAPIAFWLALFALPIIGFYILKVRLRRIPVSTSMFWDQIYDEKKPRSIWQQLRHLLSLLVQLLILALLVAAIADPFLPWQKQQARRICLILDNSASMSVEKNGKSRLDLAKEKCLSFLEGIREMDEVAIVVVNSAPRVAVGMTGHIPTLKQAIQQIPQTDSGTSLPSAILLGERLVGNHPHGEVLLYSDTSPDARTTASQDAPVPSPVESPVEFPVESTAAPNDGKPVEPNEPATKANVVQVVWERIGEETRNVGITQFQVRRSLVDAIGYEILTTVLNATEHPIEARLELSLEGLPIDILPVRIPAGEKWSKAVEKTSLEGGMVSAQLTNISIREEGSKEGPSSKGDGMLNGLKADDQAFALLPGRKEQNVLIVTPGNLFLRRAFEANPLVQVTVVNEIPTEWPSDSLIVLHKWVPKELPARDLFIIDPMEEGGLWKLEGAIADPIVTDQAEDSPLMRHIRMDNVVVPEAKKVVFQGPVQSLASTVSNDSIYAELKRDSGRCLFLNVSLEESDLAFRTAFPIMVTNALHWFARQEDRFAPALATGSIANVTLNSDSIPKGTVFELQSPDGVSVPVAPTVKAPQPGSSTPSGESASSDTPSQPSDEESELRFSVGPLSSVGVWKLVAKPSEGNQADEDSTVILHETAVNLANAQESDVRSHFVEENGMSSSRGPGVSPGVAGASIGWFTRPFWFYLALLVCFASVLEWIMYQRRILS